MLNRLTVRCFKSLRDVTVDLPRLAVLFGPNAVGKSNLVDAVHALSWLGNARTLFDALGGPLPIRGHAFEAFSMAPDGLPALLQRGSARFILEADLASERGSYRYRIAPEIDFGSGHLSVADEYLAQLSAAGNPKGTAAIERVDANLHVRRKGKPAHPRQEPLRQNHSILSDRSLSGAGYPWLEHVRTELLNWRTYYFEPRMAMRTEESPADVYDIGVHGEYIAAFLYKLRAEHQKHFDAVVRTVRSIVPSIKSLSVDLDQRRGTLNLLIRQAGVEYSSRVVSEGTLRVLALCTIALSPWGGSLLTLEEPENGVHPRRIELIARLLFSLAEHRLVVVTTHSPLFVDAILKLKNETAVQGDVRLFNVRLASHGTVVEPFDVSGGLFKDKEIADALNRSDDGLFESLALRGYPDE